MPELLGRQHAKAAHLSSGGAAAQQAHGCHVSPCHLLMLPVNTSSLILACFVCQSKQAVLAIQT